MHREGVRAVSDVAVIGGTGNQGYGLALRWALAGKHITIGSRDAARAEAAAARLRAAIEAAGKAAPELAGLVNEAAAADAPVVVVAVPPVPEPVELLELQARTVGGATKATNMKKLRRL